MHNIFFVNFSSLLHQTHPAHFDVDSGFCDNNRKQFQSPNHKNILPFFSRKFSTTEVAHLAVWFYMAVTSSAHMNIKSVRNSIRNEFWLRAYLWMGILFTLSVILKSYFMIYRQIKGIGASVRVSIFVIFISLECVASGRNCDAFLDWTSKIGLTFYAFYRRFLAEKGFKSVNIHRAEEKSIRQLMWTLKKKIPSFAQTESIHMQCISPENLLIKASHILLKLQILLPFTLQCDLFTCIGFQWQLFF